MIILGNLNVHNRDFLGFSKMYPQARAAELLEVCNELTNIIHETISFPRDRLQVWYIGFIFIFIDCSYRNTTSSRLETRAPVNFFFCKRQYLSQDLHWTSPTEVDWVGHQHWHVRSLVKGVRLWCTVARFVTGHVTSFFLNG